MMNKLLLAVAVLISCPTLLSAQNLYSDIPALLKSSNPDLRALRADNIFSVLEAEQANRLQDPEIEGGYLWGKHGSDNRWDISVTQSFDFPGLYHVRSRQTDIRRRVADASYRVALLDKTIEARSILIDLTYNNMMAEKARKLRSMFSELTTLLERGHKMGQIGILDVNKARIESANASLDVEALDTERISLETSLRLLGIEVPAELHYPIDDLKPLDYYIEAINSNPLFQLMEQNRELARATSRVYSMESMPSFKIGYVHEYEEGQSFNGLKASVTLPSFSLFGKKRLNRARIGAVMEASSAAEAAAISSITATWQKAIQQKKSLVELGIVFNATDNLELLQKAYHGGQISLIDYLREIIYFVDSERNYRIQQRDYYHLLNTLSRTL